MLPFRISFRFKLISSFTILAFVIISIFTFFSYYRAGQVMQAEFKKYGLVLTETFAQMATTYIFDSDYVTIIDNATQLMENSDIRSITIFDTTGKIWVSTDDRMTSPLPVNQFYKDIIQNQQIKHRKIQYDADAISEFVSPITALGRVSHLVSIRVSLQNMQNQLFERIRNVIILSFAMISIAVLFAIGLSKSFTDPIKNLVDGTHEIARGHLDHRISINSEDEIGELTKSFNIMADNLQAELAERKQAEAALKTHRDSLEILVKERTAKLEKANREMKLEMKERKQAEKALRDSEDKLARSKKMESLGFMAGGIAHDLNNILSGIVSYPELLLLDLPLDSPQRKAIETIKKSGQRAADVVSDLLTVARGAARVKEVRNLNVIIEEYLDSVEHQNLVSSLPLVTFRTQLDSDLLNVSCSPTHLKKCLMNLVTNATEAIENSGTVTIFTKNRYLDEPLKGYQDIRIGEYVVLSVTDDGLGITPEDLERIFEPFYTNKVMGRSGTGLGLAVVWNTVQDHEGYINVKSSGGGTIFDLYFPVTHEKLTGEEQEVPMDEYLGQGEKVLVVDDEDNQREIACLLLDKLGYDAEAVSGGKEAIAYLTKNPVDLVVLDIIMPNGMNGRETYEEIIKICPGQKAIIASGFAKTEDVEATQALGAGKYIKKPYTIEKIGLTVKEELGK